MFKRVVKFCTESGVSLPDSFAEKKKDKANIK